MIILAIDSALGACSAAVLDGDHVRASRSEPMQRGHQERLALLVAETMQEAGVAFSDLDRIAVTTGPGSFTGLRVGLAFARSMALALGRPCVGIGALEALAAGAGSTGMVAAAIDAGRGQIYLQVFSDGRPLSAPEAVPAAAAPGRLADFAGGAQVKVIGSAADQLAGGPMTAVGAAAPDPAVVARLAAAAPAPETPPAPLYLRAPDARLPA